MTRLLLSCVQQSLHISHINQVSTCPPSFHASMVEKSLKVISFSYVGSSTSLCGCLLVLLECLRSSTHKDNRLWGAGFMILLVAFLVTNCITYCLGLGRVRIYDFLYTLPVLVLTPYLCCGSTGTTIV